MKFPYRLFEFLPAAFLFATPAAFATNKVGNGGNVVVCKGEKGTSVTLLDYYEANISSTLDKRSDSGETALSMAQRIFGKLRLIAPELEKQYLLRSQNILNDFDYKSNAKLIPVPDSLHGFEPKSKDCQVVQAIVRKPQVVQGEKRFLVDQELWDMMDQTQKAGLVMHEIIYEHFSMLGESDSVKARKFNSFLFAQKFSKKEFWAFLKTLDIAIYP